MVYFEGLASITALTFATFLRLWKLVNLSQKIWKKIVSRIFKKINNDQSLEIGTIRTFPVIVMMDPPLGARCSKRGHAY